MLEILVYFRLIYATMIQNDHEECNFQRWNDIIKISGKISNQKAAFDKGMFYVTCVHLLRVSTNFYITPARNNTDITTWVILHIIIVLGSPYTIEKNKTM